MIDFQNGAVFKHSPCNPQEVNVQGLTGRKRDHSSLPYNKIQAWSVATAGTLDLDAELELWFSGLGKVHLDFKGRVDIQTIGKLIGQHVL
jgi:hypothetical protein